MASIISAGTTSGTSLNLSGDTSGVLQLATNGSTTAVTITTAQNVGIGTASPSFPLDISAASGTTARIKSTGNYSYLRLDNTSATGGGAIACYQNGSQKALFGVSGAALGDTSGDGIIYAETGQGIRFTTNGASERMRITSSGDVGIGKSSYSSMTTDGVWFQTPDFNQMSNTSNTNATLFLNQNGTGAMQEWRLANAIKGTFNQYGLGLGTAVPSSGTGITFPATQSASSDANTLDDYEEGTWTPTDDSGAGLTFIATSGAYVKIGRQVTAWGYVQFPSTANGNNSILGGIPFAAANAPQTRGGGMLAYTTETTLARMLGPTTGTSTVIPYTSAGGRITNATLSTDEIYFCVTYYV